MYLVLIGEPPDPSSHFRRKDEEQEEEELNGTNNDVNLQNTLQYFGSHTHVQYTHATHQSQHAWRLLHGSAAAKEAHHHHESPRCDQDVHTWQTHKEPIIKTRNTSDLFFPTFALKTQLCADVFQKPTSIEVPLCMHTNKAINSNFQAIGSNRGSTLMWFSERRLT